MCNALLYAITYKYVYLLTVSGIVTKNCGDTNKKQNVVPIVFREKTRAELSDQDHRDLDDYARTFNLNREIVNWAWRVQYNNKKK